MKVLDKVVSYAKGFQLQVNLLATQQDITGYCENHIHQNIRRENQVLTVKVTRDGRQGAASVNLLDDGSLRWVVQSARENMEGAGKNPGLPPLARPQAVADPPSYFPATANIKAKDKALACQRVLDRASEEGLEASGSYSTEVVEMAVANTAGVRVYSPGTRACFTVCLGFGYADRLTKDVRELDYDEVFLEALGKGALSGDVKTLRPGRYDVVLEEYAVADLLGLLGSFAFGRCSGPVLPVVGENITVWDDGLAPEGLCSPFDAEGTPKRRVTLIENGHIKGVVHDCRSALKDGAESTGHAPWGEGENPGPRHMLMATGALSKEELVRSTDKGLLITKLCHTILPYPHNPLIAGSTQGVFLIEGGAVTSRVSDLRFTESLTHILSQVAGIASTARLTGDRRRVFNSVVPAIRVEGFSFF